MAAVERWCQRHGALAGGRQGSVLAGPESRVERTAPDVGRRDVLADVHRRYPEAAVQAAGAAWRQSWKYQPRRAAVRLCRECVSARDDRALTEQLIDRRVRRGT